MNCTNTIEISIAKFIMATQHGVKENDLTLIDDGALKKGSNWGTTTNKVI